MLLKNSLLGSRGIWICQSFLQKEKGKEDVSPRIQCIYSKRTQNSFWRCGLQNVQTQWHYWWGVGEQTVKKSTIKRMGQRYKEAFHKKTTYEILLRCSLLLIIKEMLTRTFKKYFYIHLIIYQWHSYIKRVSLWLLKTLQIGIVWLKEIIWQYIQQVQFLYFLS